MFKVDDVLRMKKTALERDLQNINSETTVYKNLFKVAEQYTFKVIAINLNGYILQRNDGREFESANTLAHDSFELVENTNQIDK
jgi:hypothetical protein